MKILKCRICGDEFERGSSSSKYCVCCAIEIRRLQDRQEYLRLLKTLTKPKKGVKRCKKPS